MNWWKITICVLLWICMVASYSISEISFYYDPSSTYDKMNSNTFLAFKILTFILACIILIYMLVNYYKFFKSYDGKIWRYKIYGNFSIYFIFTWALFLFTGSYQLYQFDGSKVLLSIALMNLYIFYMQYLWAPSEEGIKN